MYDEVYIAYEELAKHYRRRAWTLVLKAFKKDCSFFADVGSGPGQNSIYVASLNPKVRGVLIDLSQSMIAKFVSICPEDLKHRLYPVVGDMVYLPLRDSCLDSIIVIASLHHITSKENRLQALKEFHRVLKEDGLMLVTVWSRWQYELVKEAFKEVKQYLLRRKKSFWDVKRCSGSVCREYHLYTLGELVRDVKSAGFKILDRGVYTPAPGKKLSKNYFCLCSK